MKICKENDENKKIEIVSLLLMGRVLAIGTEYRWYRELLAVAGLMSYLFSLVS